MNEITKKVIEFIDKSPTAFNAVANIKNELDIAGFEELREDEKWNLKHSQGYYVVRNDSSIISFMMPENPNFGYRIIASHSDSPCYKIKENPELVDANYIRLNIEGYGGMIHSTWFDRPLSIAGRLIIRTGRGIESVVFDADRDLLMIPSLAIHMDKLVNKGKEINVQRDMLPIMMEAGEEKTLRAFAADIANIDEKSILGSDLFVYNRMPATVWGRDNEFFSSSRIDNLECCYTTFLGFIDNCKDGKEQENVVMHAVFDNEEVGSSTMQGADSTFLQETMERISISVGDDREDFMVRVASSFMLSADNAHGAHPNYMEKSDPVNRPVLNKGVVIKYNASQKYTTDGITGAYVIELCQDNSIPYQIFTNRSDSPGGSTLGNISQAHISIRTADIGLPQLAMHSSYETAGVKDPENMYKLTRVFL